jgi:outer membrane murein-binding lipoprotein Lpp
MRLKSFLLCGAVSCGVILLPVAVHAQVRVQAQSEPSPDKVDRLQQQMDQLQQQIRTLKGEIAQAKKKSDQDSLQNAYGADVGVRSKSPLVKASPMQYVHITLGGFFAGETVYRQHNMTSDESDTFSAVPFPFQPTYGESEFRGSGRATRFTLLAEGNIDPRRKLSGYMEMDFYGVGVTSNYNQSNSWAPRIRQGYVSYDDNNYGFHFLTGQAWSLLTQNTVGITPRKENIPLTIEHNYVVGFEFTRNWQARFVQEFGPMVSAGVSVESPAELVAGGVASGNGVNGVIVNFNNAGGQFLGGGIANTFTTDAIPDIIEKVAFDPGWAHFEVFGVERFFTDNIFTCGMVNAAGVCTVPFSTANIGSTNSHTTTGAGIGGSFLWSILPSYLDVSGMAMAGKGVGRYAAGQLPDVIVAGDGTLRPIREVSGMGGLVWHPWAGLDIYGYGGVEKEDANFYTGFTATPGALGAIALSQLGVGNPNVVNFGCAVTTAASFTGGTSNCAGSTHWLTDVTVGAWQNLYNGDVGRFAVGVQWEMIGRKLFPGLSAPPLGSPLISPSTTNNIFMTSIRWYPKYPTF